MKNQEQNISKIALILSVILHIVVISLFYFGLPLSFEKLPKEEQPLTFEVLPVTAIDNIKPQKPVAKAKKPEPKKEQPKKEQPKKQDEVKAKAVKKSTPKPKETPPEQEVKKAEQKESAPKNEPKNKSKSKNNNKKEPVPTKQKTPPKKQSKPVEKKQEADPLEDILKNLEQDSDGDSAKTPKSIQKNESHAGESNAKRKAKSKKYDEYQPLSITEKNYVRRLISDNWTRPPELEYAEDINIQFYIKLDQSGKIIDYGVSQDISCPPQYTNLCAIIKQSILRAIKKIDTIDNLDVARYNIWKEFILDLNSEFLNQ